MEFSIDILSQASYFIECKFNEKIIASGTGFFVKRSDKYYLITNWHNVTGQNPVTGEYLSGKISFPNKIDVRIFRNQEFIEWEKLTIDILDDDLNKLWLEHPIHGKSVDVIAIETVIPDYYSVTTIDEAIEPNNENTPLNIGNDVFILGYPFGISSGGGLPIWKRASIASEPVIDVDDLPKLFVDTASRPGMSGSPVVLKERRPMTIIDKNKGFSRNFMRFVGVYSGRIGTKDELGAQLGIVWKSKVIEEIIFQKTQ
jgi:hypothetical protein